MTMQQCQAIAINAIERGLIKIADQATLKGDPAYLAMLEKNRERYRKKRVEFLESGKTSHGTARLRADLTGWTPEQKRERLLAQKKAWNEAHYNHKRI